MTEITKQKFVDVQQFVKTTKMHYRTISRCWKCLRTFKPSSTCHSCHQNKEEQNISWSIWKVLNHSKTIKIPLLSSRYYYRHISHFEWKHSTRSVYLKESQLFVFFQTQVLFTRTISISTKNTFHVNTKSNHKTQKCLLSVLSRCLFFLQTNVITFLSKKRKNFNFFVDIKINHSRFT
jgi:hypothetical protein